jgi:hypothetical protein
MRFGVSDGVNDCDGKIVGVGVAEGIILGLGPDTCAWAGTTIVSTTGFIHRDGNKLTEIAAPPSATRSSSVRRDISRASSPSFVGFPSSATHAVCHA